MIASLWIVILCLYLVHPSVGETKVVTSELTEPIVQEVRCRAMSDEGSAANGCWPNQNCRRKIIDGLFTQEEVHKLIEIADKGYTLRPRLGGPTIVDINTGFIRDSAGLNNMFGTEEDIFTSDDFTHYGNIIRRLKQAVMETFNLPELYFTAPTFITRIDADIEWTPSAAHDEYWHIHSDRNNTPHYQYSGLLYLSTYDVDFKGGRLAFFPDDVSVDDNGLPYSIEHPEVEIHPDLVVHPRAGRVAMFSSGPENPHVVEPVSKGQRYVLSFWFSCDKTKEFEIFLDGKAHIAFSHRVRQSLADFNKEKKSAEENGEL